MCGLTGLLDAEGDAPGYIRRRITAMTAPLVHRGPDAGDVWVGEGVALGHRRLAIVDLSAAGAQPMASACGRWVIAFNGEIYNHLDLRRELETTGAGQAWRGHSDTETLLAGIARWGLDETLRCASGMFALALWDQRERRLSLARDRMGEKPLYWGHAGSTLVFGSELKALRAHPEFPAEVCRGALVQYLRFGCVPAPRSIHPGIWKLEPGCILEASGRSSPRRHPLRPGERDGGLAMRRYWSLNEAVEAGLREPLLDEGEALETLESTLSAAVARQMVADVPLGAFLSGGIDSSLIVALMQKQSPRPVKTFTVGFENSGYDESPYAAAVARHLGTDHSAMLVTDAEARGVIPLLPDLYDEPFADSSQIPTLLVCRAARSQVSVALSGDAGDELFGGYNRYFWGPRIWRRAGRLPPVMRQMLVAGIGAVPSTLWDRLAGDRVARAAQKAEKLANVLDDCRSIEDLYQNLVSFWRRPELLVPGGREPSSLLDEALPTGVTDPAMRMMVQDMRLYLPDDILCKVDRAAMGVSLETRVPFLDPEVMALAARLPLSMKIRNNQGKWALRQILYRHVPKDLIERPKIGFSIPLGDWLRGPLRDWAEAMLAPEQLSQSGFLEPAPIRQAWREHLEEKRDRAPELWAILMLQAWRDRWT